MLNTSKISKNTSNNPENKKIRVWVGMSGGVDSSVSAALLKDAGYDVTGVFIKVWQPDNTDCGWKDERRDAMRVSAELDIPFLTFDFSEEYKKEVVDYMIDEYKAGHTPNPDVMCNRYVKFGSFLSEALKAGVDYVATGHYAQVHKDEVSGLYNLVEGADKNKDQSYFLWTLKQDDLKHILFPVGHLDKSEVRKIAEKYNLPVFDKKDSQGVCFIGHLDMKAFLKEQIHTEKGSVVDTKGQTVGEHDGALLYTVGERHGFKIFNSTPASEPYFIIEKRVSDNTLVVAPASSLESQTDKISPKEINAIKINWISNKPQEGKKYSARIRYRQEKQDCTIFTTSIGEYKEKVNQKAHIIFDKPQKGMAQGQSVVFYDGETCIGGGILSA